ncbi:MAG: mevalonate kinase [Candidatus Thorarchaeota archaeon]
MSSDSLLSFCVNAPGRVCLFGEHSDYLGLDVIAAAIDMSIEIIAKPRDDNTICVNYLDLHESDQFSLESEIQYKTQRDYIRSAFNVMARRGISPKTGWNLDLSGNIPIAAGLSSSSAIAVGAIRTILEISEESMSLDEIALRAYDAEVREFGESGGTMDHYTSAIGGVIHVNNLDNTVTKLAAELGSFVIGDSGEQKEDTVGDLRYIRTTVENEYEKIATQIDSFDRRTTPVLRVQELNQEIAGKERQMAEATLRNRDLTNRALRLLSEESPDKLALGKMLKEHHEILRDDLDRSTPKIERLIAIAYDAGALGCKINGSGGGGSMMAYAAGCEREVASSIDRAGGTAYIVNVSRGTTITRSV